jgi:predicted nuclease of predicted toxin-antitoxin system
VINLLLDEGISPSLVHLLAEREIDAAALRDRGCLRLEDYQVWELAIAETRTVVTINGRHFRRLASTTPIHHGVLVLPSGGSRTEQFSNVVNAVEWVSHKFPAMPTFSNYFVEVSEDGFIFGEEVVGCGIIPRPRLQVLH